MYFLKGITALQGACCFCLHWAVFASDGTGLLAMQAGGLSALALKLLGTDVLKNLWDKKV